MTRKRLEPEKGTSFLVLGLPDDKHVLAGAQQCAHTNRDGGGGTEDQSLLVSQELRHGGLS